MPQSLIAAETPDALCWRAMIFAISGNRAAGRMMPSRHYAARYIAGDDDATQSPLSTSAFDGARLSPPFRRRATVALPYRLPRRYCSPIVVEISAPDE